MLFIITLTLIFLSFIIVIIGNVAMIKGGEFNRKYSNKLMRLRIGFQATAILLLFLVYMT
ncbi:MAG: HIG1 domain-containing protein [Rickettsiales bacterium]|nr:HIG1 domain-containing protein [Rickettsiales bacterium]